MNPLKWSVWVRIAVVVTIVWMIGGFAAWYGKSNRLGTDDILCFFIFPVVLFWGIAWIVLGISNRKIRVRVIKILIGIVAVFALLIIFALIMDSFSTPPPSLAPQSYEEHREIAPTTLPRLQFLEELEKKLKDKGEERHKPTPGGDGRR